MTCKHRWIQIDRTDRYYCQFCLMQIKIVEWKDKTDVIITRNSIEVKK